MKLKLENGNIVDVSSKYLYYDYLDSPILQFHLHPPILTSSSNFKFILQFELNPKILTYSILFYSILLSFTTHKKYSLAIHETCQPAATKMSGDKIQI